MTRLVTVDVDSAEGLEALWAELRRHREIRNADPKLRGAILRRCRRGPLAWRTDVVAQILKALDEMVPAAVVDAYFTDLVPNKQTIGYWKRYNAERAAFETSLAVDA